jgi:hypothetical protein
VSGRAGLRAPDDLWRSIKYEEVHLNAYADGREARDGIGSWMNFYNDCRPHQADEQPISHGGVACRHGHDRGGEDCGYAASLGQRKRVDLREKARQAARDAADDTTLAKIESSMRTQQDRVATLTAAIGDVEADIAALEREIAAAADAKLRGETVAAVNVLIDRWTDAEGAFVTAA